MTKDIQDCYQTLGLEPSSSIEAIRRRYRKLIKEWHPDRFHGHPTKTREANERLKGIIPAYETLVAFHNRTAPKPRSTARSKPSPPAPKDAKGQFEEGKRHQKAREDESALKWFRQAAEQGYVEAMFEAGDLLFESHRVKKDYSEAARWYRLAGERGHAEAQFKLGKLREGGYGWGVDYREALEWYLKAAEQGHAKAQLAVGRLYASIRPGIKQDKPLAAFWLRKSAAQGLPEAEFELGQLYDWGGRRLNEDYAEAALWYRRAAEKGHDYAQLYLARLYEEGLGVAKDEREADRWLRHSDWAGRYKKDLRAGLDSFGGSLGHMYETGIGIERDLSKAVECYRKAAIWGLTNIQIRLAHLYATGSGTPRNPAEAFKWLTIANRPDDPEVKGLLQSLASELSDKNIEMARMAASKFVPAYRR
jgi:uncharacterized protein